MADREELIQQFTNVTGVDEGRARFFLESANWDADVAIATFYEQDAGQDEGVEPVVVEDDEPEVVPMSTGRLNTGAPAGRREKKPAAPADSKFATLSSLRGNSESSSDEEEGEAFYAGGSDRSGQQVLGPPKKRKNPVEDLFRAAREHGAMPVEAEQPPTQRSSAFRGTGYRLGETEEESTMVSGLPVRDKARQVDMVLRLWKNGFTVDDGELRDHKDPANQDFIQAISRGEVPQELLRLARGGEVNLNMEDHRHEDYVKPKGQIKAFSGAGHMLGSDYDVIIEGHPENDYDVIIEGHPENPAPNVISSASAASGSSSDSHGGESSVKVDSNKPTTNIQIRLADGTRLTVKLNHSHTVQDVRKYIVDQCARYAACPFVLMTTFPNKELTNEEQTLADANLLNAVIVQKLK